jgi:RNA polymerase sigma factor (sigma-70 family)
MDAASVGARSSAQGSLRSRHLLALAGDERLVEQIRRGNDVAFTVVFERYAPPLLAFCRHMLASREEAEDAVQLTFAAAHSDLLREPARAVVLKPWLFTIARNRCLSMLRAHREQPAELAELSTDGLGEQVEARAELRQLLVDVRELPAEQRAALLLAEVSDLSHAQVAEVLGCEVARVKALVFRARSALIDRRRARETRCVEIQEQLANLRGGSLRRTPVQFHLRECPACRAYREEVRNQRKMLSAALPMTPSLALKSSVLAGVGLGGGSAGGGIAAGLSSVAGALGGAALGKAALLAVVAAGGVIAVPAVVDSRREADLPKRHPVTRRSETAVAGASPAIAHRRPARTHDPSPTVRGPRHRRGQAQRRSASPGQSISGGPTTHTSKGDVPPGQAGKAEAKTAPPGQAKKSGESAVPPGQAKKTEERTVPPGQAKRSEGASGGGGTTGVKSVNGGNSKAPSQAAPKTKDKASAAPPVAEPVPAAPPAPAVPAAPPVEKPKL